MRNKIGNYKKYFLIVALGCILFLAIFIIYLDIYEVEAKGSCPLGQVMISKIIPQPPSDLQIEGVKKECVWFWQK